MEQFFPKKSFFMRFNFLLADELLLSALQPTLKHDDWTFSNCSLLHKWLITGQGEQVVVVVLFDTF